MITFLKITEILLSNIKEFFEGFFLATSSLLSSITLLLCVVLVINICNKGATKKFFVNNRNFICATLILQAVACLISVEKNLVKINVIVLVTCLLIVLYKGISVKPKKETKQDVVDVKVKKKERKKKDESI